MEILSNLNISFGAVFLGGQKRKLTDADNNGRRVKHIKWQSQFNKCLEHLKKQDQNRIFWKPVDPGNYIYMFLICYFLFFFFCFFVVG